MKKRLTTAELRIRILIWLCLRPTSRGTFLDANLCLNLKLQLIITIFHDRSKAVKALKNNNNDIVNAIMVRISRKRYAASVQSQLD